MLIKKKVYNSRLIRRIIRQYICSNDYEEKAFAFFLKKHRKWADKLFNVDYAPCFVFGGEWVLEYLNKEYKLFTEEEYPYVIYHNRKLYMPKEMKLDEIVAYIRSIETEQDVRSAHCYFPRPCDLTGKVVVDLGGAEGNFALEYIDKIEKLFIFEAEDEWMVPLQKTYEPWKEKVHIVQQFVGDGEDGTLRLDDYFHDGEVIDILKMDVEGAEASVIRGAMRTINQSPDIKLLICLYHSGNDEDEIKRMLNGFDCVYRPGRMFYLWENPISEPYLRHGVAEFVREKIC